ncbi:hypothetical protein BDQ12DRAFT_730462 [Crucibulum laeve]|uniref:Uncharacterized protein n=1 Tax=Crucibulum laeve TaxID=68775 RepID=A0A5C3MJ45_9AGAR|nr:hypothetical protein BDQ12DRAFT_730462 [Crucibulum laeve]
MPGVLRRFYVLVCIDFHSAKFSGAEGTIIEGEDLSRMIWGLDSSQFDTSKVKPKPAITHRPIPQTNTPTLYHTSQLNNTVFRDSQQDVIDISSRNVHRKHEAPISLGSSLSSTLHSTPKDYFTYMTPECGLWQRDISQSEVQGRLIYSEMAKPYVTNKQPRANEGLGLNLDWNNVFSESRIGSGLHPNSRSSKATTTFFSASHDASDKTNSFNEVKRQNQSRTVHPSRGMSALNIAHQYRTKKLLQNNLLTPPESCSPQWSPFLPTLPEYPQPASPDLNQQQLLQHIHSQLLRTSSISREFQQNHPQRLESHSNDIPTSVIERDLQSAVQTMQKLELAANAKSDVNAYRPLNSLNRYQACPLSPVSPQLQSTIIRQAPRSIPLARLVQRRLSSESKEPVIAHGDHHHCQSLTASCTQHEHDSRVQTARLSVSNHASRDVNSVAHGTRDTTNLYHKVNTEPVTPPGLRHLPKRKPVVINEKQSANNDTWGLEREDIAKWFVTSKEQKESEPGGKASRRRKLRNKHKKRSASQPTA